MNNRKVTIVTVTYNAQDVVEETMLSVINQTYDNIEYIVIDGGSTDGTVDIIRQYEDKIDYCVSEPDEGIYYAMNKAIEKATGEWINFMNAGDRFHSEHDISRVFTERDTSQYDFIYGDWYRTDGKTNHLVKTRPLQTMWQRICFSHQSLFSRTDLMKTKPFDLSYNIVSDYENYFSRYMMGYRFCSVDFPIAVILTGGFSDQSFLKRTLERYGVVIKHKNDLETHKYYIKLITQYYWKPYSTKARKLLPKNK